MKVNVFIKNTVVLVATSLVLRSVGILFRVWQVDKIGSEGMGLYQLIFSVYLLAATFSTAGISTAVTRLVADNEQKGEAAVRQVLKTATVVTLLVAAVSTAAVFFGAEPISLYLLKDARAIPSLKILAFSLPFMGLSSCFRGYFIARRKTLQPSAVQLLEQAVRIAVVVVCVSLWAEKGLTYTAAAVLCGDTVAEGFSFLANWLLYRKDLKKLTKGETLGGTLKSLLHIAVPITATSYLGSVLHTVESLLVPLKLTVFHGARGRGLELFGAIRGMALPVLFFPASFLSSLSTMLVPEVSSASAAGDIRTVRETVSRSVGLTLILSTFVACGFMFNAADIGFTVYGDRDVGQMILVLSPIVPLMYLESVTAGLLKGLDCQVNVLKFNTFDSCFRILAVLFIVPRFGIKGYLAVMMISNTFTSCLSAWCLFRAADIKPLLGQWVLMPLIVGCMGGFLGNVASSGLHNTFFRLSVSLAVQVGISALFYIFRQKKTSTLTQKTLKLTRT